MEAITGDMILKLLGGALVALSLWVLRDTKTWARDEVGELKLILKGMQQSVVDLNSSFVQLAARDEMKESRLESHSTRIGRNADEMAEVRSKVHELRSELQKIYGPLVVKVAALERELDKRGREKDASH